MKCRILRHKFALWVIAALALASCSQDELTEQGTPLPVGKYPLELTADGLQAVATPAQASTRGTFFDDDWNGVTSVKVRVNDVQEKEYSVTLSMDKKTAHLAPAKQLGLTDESFWWTSTEEKKTVMAWAPSKYVLNEEFEFPTEWTKENLAQYDIIGVKQTVKFEDRNEPLAFQHLMAKFVINLRSSAYLKAAKHVKVQLRAKSWCYGIMKISNDQLKIEAIGGNVREYLTPYHLPEEEYEEVDFGGEQPEKPFASYTALVPPRHGNYSPLLIIEVDGVKYQLLQSSFTDEQEVYYKAGQVYTFNVTVKENGLDVTVGQSIDWETDGASGSGEVELP